jgi:methyl-accepting chemotaxis protein
MLPSIRRTAELVQEVAAASTEQARTVVEINKTMGHVDEITQRTAAAAEELSATAEEMSAQAESLQQLVTFFREETLRPGPAGPSVPPTASVSEANGNGYGAPARPSTRLRSPATPTTAAANEHEFTPF